MTRIVCLSDTHNLHDRVAVPDGDILVHAGDFCERGSKSEVSKFLDWVDALPHRTKIVVPGNHEVCVEEDIGVRREFVRSGIELLIDKAYVDPWSGLKFYGVPWTPDFYPDNWGFQYKRAGTTPSGIWARVPDDTDILVSHGPPFGFGDQRIRGETPHLGCRALARRLSELRGRLQMVLCGHVHGGHGAHAMWDGGLPVVNVAICNQRGAPVNSPFVWDAG